MQNGQSSSVQTWKQTFQYDRYGNRAFDEANTTTLPTNCGTSPSLTVCTSDRKVVNPTPNTSDNRLSSNDGYSYDLSGNTTKDAQLRKFTYDAENKQTKVETVDQSNNVTGTLGEYLYDGDGKRVKKVSAAEETIFVYDAAGKLIAEYSTALNPTPQVSYLTNDHLGSPRINTDEKGNVIARHDYQPFGEEITQGRNTQLGYNDEAVRKQFTGYEKDEETDLDFAQARYYAENLGRFNSVDSLYFQLSMAVDPQRFNLYGYARNNPHKWIDPSGESLYLTGNKAFLQTNVLYEMAGGQEEFEKYFHIKNGQVLANQSVDASNGNDGIRFLSGLVGATENFVYFAGTSFDDLSQNYDGFQDQNGNVVPIGATGRANFTEQFEGGLGDRQALPVYATSGRSGSFHPKPLANGDAVFAVIAINTNVVSTQREISTDYKDSFLGLPESLNAQSDGVGQTVRAVSYFIHESSENLNFASLAQQGMTNLNDSYPSAHQGAMRTEAAIRKNLNITGGFAGGTVNLRIPRAD